MLNPQIIYAYKRGTCMRIRESMGTKQLTVQLGLDFVDFLPQHSTNCGKIVSGDALPTNVGKVVLGLTAVYMT